MILLQEMFFIEHQAERHIQSTDIVGEVTIPRVLLCYLISVLNHSEHVKLIFLAISAQNITLHWVDHTSKPTNQGLKKIRK